MIDIIRPGIFDTSRIISGVTLKNENIFPGTGFSVSSGKILSRVQVIRHRKFLASELSWDYDKIKFQRQVHHDDIRLIDPDSPEEESDGMISNDKGLILSISIADCCAILVWDPINEAIGSFHSGWKGTSLNLAGKGIQKMKKHFGSRPNTLKAYLSPCASGSMYEVGPEVADIFPGFTAQIRNDKFLFDNRQKIESQLLAEGLISGNIEISEICTIQDIRCHSYRRERDKAGRMSAFIGLLNV